MTRHSSIVRHTATQRAAARPGLRAGAIRRVENASQFSTLRGGSVDVDNAPLIHRGADVG